MNLTYFICATNGYVTVSHKANNTAKRVTLADILRHARAKNCCMCAEFDYDKLFYWSERNSNVTKHVHATHPHFQCFSVKRVGTTKYMLRIYFNDEDGYEGSERYLHNGVTA